MNCHVTLAAKIVSAETRQSARTRTATATLPPFPAHKEMMVSLAMNPDRGAPPLLLEIEPRFRGAKEGRASTF
jgi:hypothetical protein